MTNNTKAQDLIERLRGTFFRFESGYDITQEAADALEAAQARIAELEGALVSCRHSAIWTPRHPACERVIETVNAALQEGKG